MTHPFELGADAIQNALQSHYRAYLVGSLSLPQELPHIEWAGVEIGLSSYASATSDTPHSHDDSLECLYVLEGEYHVWLFGEERPRTLRPGDFLALPSRTAYASKATRALVLFVKSPGGQDKRERDPDATIRRWLETPAPMPAVVPAAPDEAALQHTLEVLAITSAEWQHRDTQMLAMSYRWFLASLFVSLLPNLWNYFEVDTALPPWVFITAGAAMSVYFLFITLAYSARLTVTGLTLSKLQSQLPERLRRVSLGDVPLPLPQVTRAAIAVWTPWAMFGFLAAVNVASLISAVN